MGQSAPRPPLADLRAEGIPPQACSPRPCHLPGAGPALVPAHIKATFGHQHVGVTLRAVTGQSWGTALGMPLCRLPGFCCRVGVSGGVCTSAHCAPNLMISQGRHGQRGPGAGCLHRGEGRLPRRCAWRSAKQQPKLHTNSETARWGRLWLRLREVTDPRSLVMSQVRHSPGLSCRAHLPAWHRPEQHLAWQPGRSGCTCLAAFLSLLCPGK